MIIEATMEYARRLLAGGAYRPAAAARRTAAPGQ
jgi:hypothetical protein